MAESTTVSIPDIEKFKKQALYWANHFSVVCLLDTNHYAEDKYHSREWVLAIDAVDEITGGNHAFEQLKRFQESAHSEIFGFLGYDLKNQIEQLNSNNPDNIGLPDIYFFKPRYIFEITKGKLTLNRNYPETFELIELIAKLPLPDEQPKAPHEIHLQSRTAKTDYFQNVTAIRQQIEEGDFYELNYCNEFYAEEASISPLTTFFSLNQKSLAPFSCFFKLQSHYLLCASPERFLKKEKQKLISQPIKGTIRKGLTEAENAALKNQLHLDAKERAENVMIVDLVRNDLAKSAKAGTVVTEELFQVYEFKTIQQMISTITAEMREDINWCNALKNTFPMGSMTGAPKVMVMQMIEKYENFKRGLFSGSVGYIKTDGDFDFNVVIRCILYNASAKYLSLRVGGAITYDSVPEKEYAEILLKAKGILEVLNASVDS